MRVPKHDLSTLRAAWRTTLADSERTYRPTWDLTNVDGAAKLYVHGMIGGYELDASEFVKSVHALDAKTIDLHVNSPGGFVFDAVAMYEAVKSHPATVTTHIDGLAASAASFLALAGDTVSIAKAGRMMIHDAQGVGIGSPADMREYADLLDAVSNDIAGYYADRAGGKPASWRAAMSATTWYSATQAVDAGLADRVTGDSKAGPDNRTRLIQARVRALATQGG
jgi:ATP-dependent protease ClpP protease subunit